MPITVAPNTIELSDFSAGFMPDFEPATTPLNGLRDVLNMLPDVGTGALQTRKGFYRVMDSLAHGYTIESLFAYTRVAGETTGNYLIAVASDHSDGEDNIVVYAVNLDDLTAEAISPTNQVWGSSNGRHWGATINDTFFGGGPGDTMYSWNPDDGWDGDPSVLDYPELVDISSSSISAVELGTNEKQTLSLVSGTGNFKLRLKRARNAEARVTDNLAEDCTAAQVKTALGDLAGITEDDLTVTGGPLDVADIDVTFKGKWQRRDIPLMTVTSADGVDVLVTETTPGVQYRASDEAFASGEKVNYDDRSFEVARLDNDGKKVGIKYRAWKAGREYKRKDRMSIYATWGTDVTGTDVAYWRSFECTEDHTASTGNKPPAPASSANEQQRLTVDADGGWFRVLYDDVAADNADGGRLPFDISYTDLETALDTIPALSGNVSVSQDTDGDNEIQRIHIAATGGTWRLYYQQWGGGIAVSIPVEFNDSAKLAYNITAADLETAIEGVVGAGNVDVTRDVLGAGYRYHVEFKGDYAGANMDLMSVSDGALTGGDSTATINVEQPGGGRGSFIIEFDNELAQSPVHLLEARTTHLEGDVDVSRIEHGHGAGGKFWRAVTLLLPLDEDGEVTEDWNLVPTASQTNVGTWHDNRLWLRWDNNGPMGKTRIQHSALMKPVKNSDIGEFEFDPKNFAPDESEQGEGGGWLDVHPGDGDEVVSLFSYGYYLLIFKRRTTWVLSGADRNTWTVRKLADVGCASRTGVVEHNGLVYFISDEGVYYTDGTQAAEVPGGEKVRDWVKDMVDWDTDRNDVVAWSHDGFVWFGLPVGDAGIPTLTLVYHPDTESFWPQTLRVACAATQRTGGTLQLFFAMPTQVENADTGTLAIYNFDGYPGLDPDGSLGWGQSNKVGGKNGNARNLFADQGFEPHRKVTNAEVKAHWDKENWEEARQHSAWMETSPNMVKFHYSPRAARHMWVHSVSGAIVTNLRQPPQPVMWVDDGELMPASYGYDPEDLLGEPDWDAMDLGYPPHRYNHQPHWEGIYQDFDDELDSFLDDDYERGMRFWVRRDNWREDRHIGYADARLFVGGESIERPIVDHPSFHEQAYDSDVDNYPATRVVPDKDPTCIIPKADMTYTYKGMGWWRVAGTYTGSADVRHHGIIFAPGLTVHVEKAMCRVPLDDDDFGGDGGGETGGGGDDDGLLMGAEAVIFQYNHPTVQTQPTDDAPLEDPVTFPIPWFVTTAWVSFGVLREIRQIRRIWAMVRGRANMIHRGMHNWHDDLVFEVNRALPNIDFATHIYGRYHRDSAAVSGSVEGLGAPAAFLGYAVHTIPRRAQYYTGEFT